MTASTAARRSGRRWAVRRDEEGARDLLRPEAAQRPQRQGHLGVERQRRVAAGEQQLEPLVADRGVIHLVTRRLGRLQQAELLGAPALPADPVDRPVSGRRHQPRPGALRDAVSRPALRGDGERLLRGFLGEVEVAEEADQ
jgi:hypothetical protein